MTLMERRRAIIGAQKESLSTWTPGTYGRQTVVGSNGVISVYDAGATESNGIIAKFSPPLKIKPGDTVKLVFAQEFGSPSWKSRSCSIFLWDGSAANSLRFSNNQTIGNLNGLEISAIASANYTSGRLTIRLHNQGVTYDPPYKFSTQIYVNGRRMV